MADDLFVGSIVQALYTDEQTAALRGLKTNTPYAAIVIETSVSHATLRVFRGNGNDLCPHVALQPSTAIANGSWVWRWPVKSEPWRCFCGGPIGKPCNCCKKPAGEPCGHGHNNTR